MSNGDQKFGARKVDPKELKLTKVLSIIWPRIKPSNYSVILENLINAAFIVDKGALKLSLPGNCEQNILIEGKRLEIELFDVWAKESPSVEDTISLEENMIYIIGVDPQGVGLYGPQGYPKILKHDGDKMIKVDIWDKPVNFSKVQLAVRRADDHTEMLDLGYEQFSVKSEVKDEMEAKKESKDPLEITKDLAEKYWKDVTNVDEEFSYRKINKEYPLKEGSLELSSPDYVIELRADEYTKRFELYGKKTKHQSHGPGLYFIGSDENGAAYILCEHGRLISSNGGAHPETDVKERPQLSKIDLAVGISQYGIGVLDIAEKPLKVEFFARAGVSTVAFQRNL